MVSIYSGLLNLNFVFKEKYTIDDLLQIMTVLRSPEGCPWDREQTHESIRQCLLEETYEVAEAIDNSDTDLLCEELGDLLLQITLHSEMEREKETFDFSDVVDGVCKKMIVRHPHVFGDVSAETSEQVLQNWDEIKKQTKGQKSQSESMKSISVAMPALMRSQKIQQKAAKVGFDWNDVSGALEKLREEVNELEESIAEGDCAHMSEELGDVMFAAVNVARFIDVSAEKALSDANQKFVNRFSAVEKLAEERKIYMKSASLEELDALWDEVKKNQG